jgi:hypothetical protein
MIGMNMKMRCCVASPVFGVSAICHTMLSAMTIGSRLIGNPSKCATVSGCERSFTQRKLLFRNSTATASML